MRVAVGVIADEQGRLLITQRPHNTTHAEFWEFPGGKLHDGESPQDALLREIDEEVGLAIKHSQFLGDVTYTYSDRTVTLHVFFVNAFTGNATCREGQLALRWVGLDETKNYRFPAANETIIKMVEAITER